MYLENDMTLDDTDAGTDPETYDGTTDNVAGKELLGFIERLERLEAEKAEIAEQLKEVMAEAKGRGYNTKCIKALIAERKRNPDDVAEEESILELYRAAVGRA